MINCKYYAKYLQYMPSSYLIATKWQWFPCCVSSCNIYYLLVYLILIPVAATISKIKIVNRINNNNHFYFLLYCSSLYWCIPDVVNYWTPCFVKKLAIYNNSSKANKWWIRTRYVSQEKISSANNTTTKL